MLQLAVLPFMVAYGAYRFVQAARTGVVTGPKLGARRADQPVAYAVSMTLLGGATLASAWLFLTMLAGMHVSFSAGR